MQPTARFGVVNVQVSVVRDFTALGQRWRDLEERSNGSFFQSWSWVGCLAEERYGDPIVVEAVEAGRTVALGLFNRVRRRFGQSMLYLSESGSVELDCPYIEQNGILATAGREVELSTLCLRPLAAAHDIVLSGVSVPVLEAAQRAANIVVTARRQPSPFVDLEAIRRSGYDYLGTRSSNARQQLRRSDRYFEQNGAIRVVRAGSVAVAHEMLGRLAELHRASWERRGKPGSFAVPFFRRFHAALIESAFPRAEIDLLEILAGERIIGLLYNFAWRGQISAYQSGFAYSEGVSHAKPGLTCHVAAIRQALGRGIQTYDFLAGDARYKRSLSDQSYPLFWAEAGRFWSPRLLRDVMFKWFREGG